MFIKLSHIRGLKKIVIKELFSFGFTIIDFKSSEDIYVEYDKKHFDLFCKLKSVQRAYLVLKDIKYTPYYVSKHKSVLDSLLNETLLNSKEKFKTFKIICAGRDSNEIKDIEKHISEKYKLIKKENADLKIHLIKIDKIWEIGVQITARPLSQRFYKEKNMPGAMDPTIAFSMNFLSELSDKKKYLNIFSGSGTLLIEAFLINNNLNKIIGFDNNKKNLSLSVQNIKKAKLIKKIEIKEADIFDNLNFGKFDVITSDLPFGMAISKNENLDKLYEKFIKYCAEYLNKNGVIVAYTSEYDLFLNKLKDSNFKVVDSYSLSLITNSGCYLKPKIFVCKI